MQEQKTEIDLVQTHRATIHQRLPVSRVVVERKEPTPVGVTPYEERFSWHRATLDTPLKQNLFKSHQWLAEQPKNVKPPVPVAPPVPFIFVGKIEDTPQGTRLILMNQQQVLTPLLGEKINSDWKLEKEDPEHVYCTYLPLNQMQVLLKKSKAMSMRGSESSVPVNGLQQPQGVPQ